MIALAIAGGRGHDLASVITTRRFMRPRYALLAALIVCALHYDAGCPAAAQSWPIRPLTMVVPFAAGGGTDVLGRIIGQRLSEILGQQVIIDNLHMGIEAQQMSGLLAANTWVG